MKIPYSTVAESKISHRNPYSCRLNRKSSIHPDECGFPKKKKKLNNLLLPTVHCGTFHTLTLAFVLNYSLISITRKKFRSNGVQDGKRGKFS